jgi:hypothetical protein
VGERGQRQAERAPHALHEFIHGLVQGGSPAHLRARAGGASLRRPEKLNPSRTARVYNGSFPSCIACMMSS